LFGDDRQRHELRGRVQSDSGNPISAVKILVKRTLSPQGGSVTRETTSDGDGRFVLNGLDQGTYLVVTEKQGWYSERIHAAVRDLAGDTPAELRVTLRMTPLYLLLTRLQFGSTLYLMLFGLLVFVFNFYMVPEPARGVTVFGWVVVGASIFVAFFKMGFVPGSVLGVIGIAVGLLIQKYGRRTAGERLQEEAREREVVEAAVLEEQIQIETLIGVTGVAVTDLKAFGSARFGGDIMEVRSHCGYISQHTRIVITRIDGRTPVVEAV
jgi:hypothetical protein